MRFSFIHGETWQKTVTYALVTIITSLVWLYAEAENVKVHEENGLEVRILDDKDRLIDLGRPESLRVNVQFRCAAGQITELRQLCQQPFEINVDDLPEGVHNLELKTRLAMHQGIADLGIAVESVDPPRIREVTITNLVSVKMEIIATSDGQKLDAVVEPPRAEVRVPAHREDIGRTMQLTAAVEERFLSDLTEGEHLIPDVAVSVPSHLRKQTIRIVAPLKVKVRVNIRTQSKTISRSVPVYILGPKQVLADFQIEPENESVTVELTGPIDTIERIERRDILIWAELHFFSHDVISEQVIESTTTHALKFDLPANVRTSTSTYQMPVAIRRRSEIPAPETQ